MPESDANSVSHRPKKRSTNNTHSKTKEANSKHFLKTNIGDFKQKILGAMHQTNEAIQNAGKKQDGPSSVERNNFYDSMHRESSVKSQKGRSPSANHIKPP